MVESELYREREATITPGKRTRIIVAEWIITFLIGELSAVGFHVHTRLSTGASTLRCFRC